MCVVNVVDSFIPFIMLKMIRFKSAVLLRMHTLLDRSLPALQLPTNISKLTANK